MSDIEFNPQTKEELLAQELVEKLGDPEGLAFYLKIAKRYRESYIRTILGRTLEIPADRIRKSRAALFNWLLNHHGERRPQPDPAQDPRD